MPRPGPRPPAAAGAAPGQAPGVDLPGSPRRIELGVTARSEGTSWAAVSLLLRDRFGATHGTPSVTLPTSGDATLTFPLDTLTGAPIGSAAAPLTLAGIRLSYAGDEGPAGNGSELTLRRIGVSDTADGGATAVAAPGPAATGGWQSSPPQGPRSMRAPALSPVPAGSTDHLQVRYWGGSGTEKGVSAVLFPAPTAPAPAAVPAVATTDYLRSVGASVGATVPVTLDGATIPMRVTAALDSLPVVGRSGLAVDLRTLGRFLVESAGQQLLPRPPSGGCPPPRPPIRSRPARRTNCAKDPGPSASSCARKSPRTCWRIR